MKRYVSYLAVVCLIGLSALFGNSMTVKGADTDFALRVESTEPTNQPVKVIVTADSNRCTEMKWAKGNKDITFFQTKGDDVLYSKKKLYFMAETNGTYSVYVKDTKGKETIKIIDITNIDKKKPTITYRLDATDRSCASISMDIEDKNTITDVRYYYGKLTKAEDKRWNNAIELKEPYEFVIYKNGTTTVRVTDLAGNVALKTISVKYINRTNQNVDYGMDESIQIMDYFGKIVLRINSVNPITYGDQQKGYSINYYVKNVDYAGMNTCFVSNRKFRVYNSQGKELQTAPIEFNLDGTFCSKTPEQINSGRDNHYSFIVYGEEQPAYVDYIYWNSQLQKTSIRILLTKDFAQEVREPSQVVTNQYKIEKVKDYKINNASYSGTTVNEVRQGVGRYTYEDGSVYEGEFYQGKRHGYGKMTYRDHSTYEGEFLNDQCDGFGVYREYGGYLFTGIWKEGSRIKGKLVDTRGKIYYIDSTK